MKNCERLQLNVEAMLAHKDPNSAYWIEAESGDTMRNHVPITWLRSALIDTSANFRTDVLEHYSTVVLTSAT